MRLRGSAIFFDETEKTNTFLGCDHQTLFFSSTNMAPEESETAIQKCIFSLMLMKMILQVSKKPLCCKSIIFHITSGHHSMELNVIKKVVNKFTGHARYNRDKPLIL